MGDISIGAPALTSDRPPVALPASLVVALKDAFYRHRALAARVAAVAIALAAVAGYLGYVARYSSNAVWLDEWNWVGLMSNSYAGTLSLGDLLAPYNENRILFPNLILLVLGRATGLSMLALIYVGAALLIAAVLLLVVACRGDVLKRPLLYVPATFIFFSLAQYENSLWGIQLSLFLVIACIAGVLTLLSAPRLQAWRLSAAAAVAIIASFSFVQGLTIWPAGLIALLRPGVSRNVRLAWCAVGVVVTAFYLHDLNVPGLTPVKEFVTRFGELVYGFFVAVGGVVPDLTLVNARYQPDYSVTAVFGVIIVLAGGLVVLSWLLHGRGDRVLTIAAALVVVGVLVDLMLMPSRLNLGIINATISRYTTFNLLLLGGAYLGAMRTLSIALDSSPPHRIAANGVFAGLMLALVFIQVPAATRAGILGGIISRANHTEAANLTANYRTAPKSLVLMYGYPPSYDYFETEAAFLEANHLNVFADGESATYQRSGVVKGGVVVSPLPVPPEFGPIRSYPEEWQAWLALSSVYEQRPDLQNAFPGPTVGASRQMVAWALGSGLDPLDPADAEVLRPHASQYRVWLAQEA